MSWRRAAHLALVLVGLALAVYGLVRVAHPDVSCRGVEMRPGDVCHKNDFGALGTDKTQSYEQRVAAARSSAPVVVGMGVVVGAFGFALYRRESR